MDLLTIFSGLAVQEIDNYVTNSAEENLNLDFKTINRADLTHADDKRNLAKALSGFANSSGGLIVWGVDARKNTEGIDCACTKKPILPLQLFLSRLNQVTGEAISPSVPGINHRAISIDGDSGFAVTIVPESETGPHMAKLGEDRYYKRSGDSFYKMEHYDLEDMFGRRKHPKLQLIARIGGGGGGSSGGKKYVNVQVTFALENTGRGAAKAPLLGLTIKSKHRLSDYGIDGNGNFGLEVLPHSHGMPELLFGGSSITVIHPGTYREVCAITLKVTVDSSQVEDVIVDFVLTSEDSRPESGTCVTTKEDIFAYAVGQLPKMG